MMGSLGTAVGQGVRSVMRARMVSAGVVALLALGIGSTVTVLSVVDGVLIRALPYPDADRLVMVDEGAHSWPDFLDWRENVAAFDAVVAGSGFTFTLSADVPEHVDVVAPAPDPAPPAAVRRSDVRPVAPPARCGTA